MNLVRRLPSHSRAVLCVTQPRPRTDLPFLYHLIPRQLNQTPSVKTPAIPWALTKDERKNYDQIFRAWDKEGTGFISGDMAREVFGQSGLGQDDMAQIWYVLGSSSPFAIRLKTFVLRQDLGGDADDWLGALPGATGRSPTWTTEES